MRTQHRQFYAMALAAAVFVGTANTPLSAQDLNTALGVWADEDGDSNIRIAPCGANFCGQIVWLKSPKTADGQPKTDVMNPDKSLRSRPLLGMTIIAGLRPDRKRKRLKGRVYNANDGQIYDIYLKPRGMKMRVKGCFIGILCGSQTWTRVR
ncbi:MAG: DUF2147 domain-containing protein [Pseudomonadota bacterium]